MGAVLFLAISLEGHRIHVVALAIGLSNRETVGVREVVPPYEVSFTVMEIELDIWHRVRSRCNYPPKKIFKVALGDPPPCESFRHERPDRTYAVSALPGDSQNKPLYIPNVKELLPKARIQTPLHQPRWSRGSQVDNSSHGTRGWNAVHQDYVRGSEILRLSHEMVEAFHSLVSTRHNFYDIGPSVRHAPQMRSCSVRRRCRFGRRKYSSYDGSVPLFWSTDDPVYTGLQSLIFAASVAIANAPRIDSGCNCLLTRKHPVLHLRCGSE